MFLNVLMNFKCFDTYWVELKVYLDWMQTVYYPYIILFVQMSIYKKKKAYDQKAKLIYFTKVNNAMKVIQPT